MRPGRIAILLGTVMLAVNGMYFFVYLWRWEWNRALIVGVLFLAVEVAMAAAAMIGRFRRLDARLEAIDPKVLSRIRESAPPARDHFEWLSPGGGSTGVFVPLLIGVGVVASGLAWLVERVSRHTAGPALERGLAVRLSALAWPAGGLAAGDDDPLAVLDRPTPHLR